MMNRGEIIELSSLRAREADNETFVKGFFFCPATQSTCEITRSIAVVALP